MSQPDVDFETNLSLQLDKVKKLVLDHYMTDQTNLQISMETKNSEQEEKFKSIIQSKNEEIQQLNEKAKKLKKKVKKQRKYKKKSVKKLWKQKLLQIYFQAWLKFRKEKKHRNKMYDYCRNFYRRGILRNNFQDWKSNARLLLKEQLTQTAHERVEQAKVKINCEYANELEKLNKIIQRLSEDLRAEKLEKETLKYQFDQAFLRGLSALQMERAILEQKKFREQVQD